jgi:DNA-binding MarR family transcriptional regulator
MRTTLSARANDAWESMLETHGRAMRAFAAEDIWNDVSMREYDVLYALSKSQVSPTISELNERVLLSQPALSRMIDRLVSRGYIERTPGSDDARCVQLQLTEHGRAAQRTVGRKHARHVVRQMSALSQDELEELERLCKKLTSGEKRK